MNALAASDEELIEYFAYLIESHCAEQNSVNSVYKSFSDEHVHKWRNMGNGEYNCFECNAWRLE